MPKKSSRTPQPEPTKQRWTTKLAHPGWALAADQCPNCGFPEAEGGYCPECGWTLPHPRAKR